MKQDVILVDIIGQVVNSMKVEGATTINYQPGRASQIMQSLNELDNSISYKNDKYQLIAMVLPVRESRGLGQYATVVIDRIVIATITEPTDSVLKRYEPGGTFKSILYPCYYEFLKQLARSKYIMCSDPDAFVHTKMDNPGTQPIGEGSTDYVDTIEILNLEIILNQIKTC